MAVPHKGQKDYPFYLAECFGKEAFENYNTAMLVTKKRAVASARQVYKCKFCGKFHVGSQGYKRGKH